MRVQGSPLIALKLKADRMHLVTNLWRDFKYDNCLLADFSNSAFLYRYTIFFQAMTVTPAMTPISPTNPFVESTNPFEMEADGQASADADKQVNFYFFYRCLTCRTRSFDSISSTNLIHLLFVLVRQSQTTCF